MIVIRGGQVYDPAGGLDGEVRDVWVDGERIAPPPPDETGAQVIDARGSIVAPAGVEIHTHVAGYGLNAARQFLAGDPEFQRLLLPPPREAARRYLALGYTTVFDAASAPLFARSAHADLHEMDCVDRGTYTLMGDHRLLLDALAGGRTSELKDLVAWLLDASGGYAVKLVNPGQVSASGSGDLDEPIGIGTLTQRSIILNLVRAANELGTPHPVHLHAGQLGLPGNSRGFCETVRALEGQRAHLTHVQFYAYGEDERGRYTSAAEQVVDCIQPFERITFDAGQVLFGPAMVVTADLRASRRLHEQIRKPWISQQLEGEGALTALPLTYLARDEASAVQWAAGLELLLRFPDPQRMFLTTDHPNGGPFTAYPQVLEWLMSRAAREEALRQAHPAARRVTGLAGIGREYSLSEIIAMTSCGPARALGLADRGTLGVGALADIRCCRMQPDLRQAFSAPEWVMRRGRIAARAGQALPTDGDGPLPGKLLVARPAWDEDRRPDIYRRLAQVVSQRPEEYALGESPAPDAQEVPCRSAAC